jgi:hypothetical protein
VKRPRQNFPKKVLRDRLDYVNANGGLCEGGCGRKLSAVKRKAGDHHLPDWLGGKPTFENCRILCDDGPKSCHAIKTAKEATDRAKSNRVRDKHEGIASTKGTIPSKPGPQRSRASRPPEKPLPENKGHLAKWAAQ